jgi:hypothetical protein
MQQALFAYVDNWLLDADIAQRLVQVQKERIVSSRQFFAENAALFREQQEQIADYELYGSAVAALLDRLPLPSRKQALEIGPGNGQFLANWRRVLKKCWRWTTTSRCWRRLQSMCSAQQLKNVALRCGEIAELPADFHPIAWC